MKENNISLQDELDRRKWLKSEKQGRDLSGKMPYCTVCTSRGQHCSCLATQNERLKSSLCAEAYGQYKEKKNVRKN